jgi:hypothetical protein
MAACSTNFAGYIVIVQTVSVYYEDFILLEKHTRIKGVEIAATRHKIVSE